MDKTDLNNAARAFGRWVKRWKAEVIFGCFIVAFAISIGSLVVYSIHSDKQRTTAYTQLTQDIQQTLGNGIVVDVYPSYDDAIIVANDADPKQACMIAAKYPWVQQIDYARNISTNEVVFCNEVQTDD